VIIFSHRKINDYGIGEADTSSSKYQWLRKQIANMKYLIRLASANGIQVGMAGNIWWD
jgi:hypothetical protein